MCAVLLKKHTAFTTGSIQRLNENYVDPDQAASEPAGLDTQRLHSLLQQESGNLFYLDLTKSDVHTIYLGRHLQGLVKRHTTTSHLILRK